MSQPKFELAWLAGTVVSDDVETQALADWPKYDGFALLRRNTILAKADAGCTSTDVVSPDQPIGCLVGWTMEYEVTYAEALDYSDGTSAQAVSDDGAAVDLVQGPILPHVGATRPEYICAFRE